MGNVLPEKVHGEIRVGQLQNCQVLIFREERFRASSHRGRADESIRRDEEPLELTRHGCQRMKKLRASIRLRRHASPPLAAYRFQTKFNVAQV